MDRRTKICILIILYGLGNFLLYVVGYMLIGPGEAVNGAIRVVNGQTHYFLHTGYEVPHWVYVYSGVHSITMWPTVGAVMLAMLTLAKERIASSMRRTIIRGRTLITILATVIAVVMVVFTLWFIRDFVRTFHKAGPPLVTYPQAEP